MSKSTPSIVIADRCGTDEEAREVHPRDYSPGFLQVLRDDIGRYVPGPEYDVFDILRAMYYNECVGFVISFRVCQRLNRLKPRWLRGVLLGLYGVFVHRPLSVILGIDIQISAAVGRGLYIGHAGSIRVGAVKIGEYCNLSQENAIGFGHSAEGYGLPTIGDRVFIAPGAKIFGHISIGDGCSIGSNAVVSKSIPPHSIVVGNPGRIVGSQEHAPQVGTQEQKRFRLLRVRSTNRSRHAIVS